MDDLPVHPGSYALFLGLFNPCLIRVGKLGWYSLPAGFYAYQGSARGPGGLRARLGRHLRGGGQLHWHIDYLREVSEVLGYTYTIREEKRFGNLPAECFWSQTLIALPEAGVPIPGFGASDCHSGCLSHLVHLSGAASLGNGLKERLALVLASEITMIVKAE